MKVVEFKNGIAIHGIFPDKEIIDVVRDVIGGNAKLPLTLTDPPYFSIVDKGRKTNCEWDKAIGTDVQCMQWMIDWTNVIATLSLPNSALYVFGGTGKPNFRPFYRYLIEVEIQTPYKLANHITWGKKRAYGIQHNYLYCREEAAYLLLGDDIKKPRMFNIPLLAEKRGYDGFNKDYPAKSEYKRRTNVWSDISELFSGKMHETQKPIDLMKVPIHVHTTKDECVFDPFAGSGTTGIAAMELGRKFILVERDETEFNKMIARLKAKEEAIES